MIVGITNSTKESQIKADRKEYNVIVIDYGMPETIGLGSGSVTPRGKYDEARGNLTEPLRSILRLPLPEMTGACA